MGYAEEKQYLDRIDDMNKEATIAMAEVRKKHRRKINNSKKKIDELGCKHHFYRTYEEDRDDGYGKWWTVTVKVCKICREKDVYTKWPLEE